MPLMPETTKDQFEDRAAKLTLMGVFLGSLALFSSRLGKRGLQFEIRPLDLLMLGLSAQQTGRIVVYDRVSKPLREPFTTTQPDSSGAGDTVVAKPGTGFRRTLGELLSCPICTGTWVAAASVIGLHLLPRPTRVFLAVTSATGIAEIIHVLIEALRWEGRESRRESAADN